MLTNGKVTKRVRGFLRDLRGSPKYRNIWGEFVSKHGDTINITDLEKTICKMRRRARLSEQERIVLKTIVLEELTQEFGGFVLT
jgi:hypothetical protein